MSGVMNAVDFIEALRSARDFGTVPVGRRVVVIGGGNTAVDAAVQSRKLGAASVTMVYRRGVESMSATWAEREFAQTNGVHAHHACNAAALDRRERRGDRRGVRAKLQHRRRGALRDRGRHGAEGNWSDARARRHSIANC